MVDKRMTKTSKKSSQQIQTQKSRLKPHETSQKNQFS